MTAERDGGREDPRETHRDLPTAHDAPHATPGTDREGPGPARMKRSRSFALLASAALLSLALGCGSSGSTGANGPDTTTSTSSTTTTAPRPVADQAPPRSTFGLAFDERRVWVADFYGGQVIAVDPETGEILKRYKPEDGVPEGVKDLTVGSDGSLFWTGFNDGQVGRMTPAAVSSIVDAFAVGTGPIAFSKDGKLYVGRAVVGDGLWEVDPNAEKKPRKISDEVGNVNAFAVGPDGAIYGPRFGLGTEGALVRIDPGSGAVTEIATGFDAPVAVKLSPDQKTAYVLSQVPGGTPKVSAVDLSTKQVRDYANALTPLVDNMTVAPDGRIFVSSFNEPVLTVIATDGTTKKLVLGQH
jgi:sugar lactone lactonase YvrE